jgi:hypothetical protein
MKRDVVHDRLRPAALPVCVADRLDEAHRRDRVARGAGAVVAFRRHGKADHVDVLVDGLQGVVARGERCFVGRGRRDRLVAVVRREPEVAEVRFVADHEVGDLREGPRDQRGVRRELVHAVRFTRHVGVVTGRDRQDDAQAALLCGRDRALELRLLLNGRRV